MKANIDNPGQYWDQRIVKPSNEIVNNSAVLQDDDALVVSLAANSKYEVLISLFFSSPANADFKMNILTSQAISCIFSISHFTAADAAEALVRNCVGSTAWTGGGAVTSGGSGAGTVCVCYRGLVNTVNACTLKVQWAQGTAQVADTTLLAGSSIEARKIS